MADQIQPVKTWRKNLTKAFLIVGLVLSILSFVGSIGLLLLYFGVYLAAVLVIVYIYAYALLSVFAVFIMIYFIIAFFAVLFGATSLDFMSGIGPELKDIFPQEFLSKFGEYSLYYLIGLPIILWIMITSLIAMIFSIVAMSKFKKSKTRKGAIAGGVFAILSSLTGFFCLHEFVGGILMFFLSDEEMMLGHEYDDEEFDPETGIITKKEVIDCSSK